MNMEATPSRLSRPNATGSASPFGAALPFLAHPGEVYQPSMESILAIFIFLLCMAVVVLVIPLYQIIGQWAGLRILRGRDYRYPFVGRWAEGWLADHHAIAFQKKI